MTPLLIATSAGKWHLAPATEMSLGSPRHHWPLSKGFDRYYGFLAGETDQYHPDLIADNHQVFPSTTPEQGYHLTEDLADHAISYLKDLRSYSTDKPFLMYFAPGACHAPHQAPPEFIVPTAAASTWAGTRGVIRSSPAKSHPVFCPLVRSYRSVRRGFRSGRRSTPTNDVCMRA